MQRYNEFVDTINKAYDLYGSDLSKDEKTIYKKMLIHKFSEDEIMEILCINSKQAFINRKKSCYIKVARWFDLEEYNNSSDAHQ